MRRFSNELWTGIVCGYFFVFAFDGVSGVVQLINNLMTNDLDAMFTSGGPGFTLWGLILNVLEVFAAVQLMRKVSYANFFASVVVFLYLSSSFYLLHVQWRELRAASYLPMFYTLSQMILAVLVLFVLRYIRTNKNHGDFAG